MAETLKIHRIPQSKYIDALRWLPPISAFDRYIVVSTFDSKSDVSNIEIQALESSNALNLSLQSSWNSPSRVSSLRVSQTLLQKPLIAASTFAGSLHILFPNPIDASLESEVSIPEKALHVGPISCIDLQENGSGCVSVGEDGRVNLISVGDSGLNYRRVFDSKGLVSYHAAKWASPTEFATGGLGFSLHWWDQRRPGGPVSQFKGNWTQKISPGMVHSIDIHPSRKHTCLAGGSSGTVFAWDLRMQQPPMVLARAGTDDAPSHFPSESDVWEVQFDTFTSLNRPNILSARILPVMICSEDGILAVVREGCDMQFGMGVHCYLGKGITVENRAKYLGLSLHDNLPNLRILLPEGKHCFRQGEVLLLEASSRRQPAQLNFGIWMNHKSEIYNGQCLVRSLHLDSVF